MKTSNLLIPFMCLFIAFTGTTQEKYFNDSMDTESYSVLDLVEENDKFSIFNEFLEASKIDTDMKYVDGFTLFIPVNEAFGEMELQKLSKLTEAGNQMKLNEFVRNYILPNKVHKWEFQENHVIDFENDGIDISTSNDNVFIGGAQIIENDIKAKDGLIHVISSLISTNDF